MEKKWEFLLLFKTKIREIVGVLPLNNTPQRY